MLKTMNFHEDPYTHGMVDSLQVSIHIEKVTVYKSSPVNICKYDKQVHMYMYLYTSAILVGYKSGPYAISWVCVVLHDYALIVQCN